MVTITTRGSSLPVVQSLPRSLLFVALLCFAHLGVATCSVSGQFTEVDVTAPYPARYSHFAFAWAGAIWVAGGENSTGLPQNDVWGSYDYGRTWNQTFSNNAAVTLPGLAASEGSRGIVYNDAVYLVSTFHSNKYRTYVSRDPALSSWTTLDDGCDGCGFFSVERMAVPFDGTGTLILVNDGSTADVWWQSATGNFQSATMGQGIKDTWTQWKATTAGAIAFTAPWGVRLSSATATDAEGLVLILTSGAYAFTFYDDVWQLSWSSSFDAPLVYKLTASPKWAARQNHLAVMVHDWLFVYGGISRSGILDDVWMSGDYGVTWTLYDAAATGNDGYFLSGLSLGRRLFITGGQGYSSATGEIVPLQDVYVSYW